MSRYDESIGPVPNPSQYYLEWDSKLNSFAYWSKEDEARIPYPLPFRFAALKFLNSVTGYDEDKRQGIYSNEVTDTRSEKLRVMYRNGELLAQGLYGEIKERVNHFGGRFTRSIYAVTPKGVIVNIKLRGSQMVNFGVIEKFGNRWQDEWIEVSEFETRTTEDGKEYSVPVFKLSSSFNPNTEAPKIDKAYEIVKHYFVSKAPVQFVERDTQQTEKVETFSTNDDDDLPF